MYVNCCGGHRHGNYCPCCGRRLATVCPCCGGSYWGWHNCVATPYIVPPQPMWVRPQVQITVVNQPATWGSSANAAIARLAGVA